MADLRSAPPAARTGAGALPIPARRTGPTRSLRGVRETFGTFGALVLLLLYNALFNAETFLTWQAAVTNLTQVATIAIVAVGMTLVIATGGIDLSVGSLMAISGSVAALILTSTVGPFDVPWLGGTLAYLLPILVAGLFGLFNGWLITSFNIQPIIATLVLFLAGRGIAQVITGGQLRSLEDARWHRWQYLGLGRPLEIPFQVIVMLLVVAAAAWAMRSTSFGRYVLAIGGNEAAARLAGVPVTRVKLAVYAISALLAGLAGLIEVAINRSADASRLGENMELDAIAAVAVGGTSLMGGKASVLGTLIGALFIQLVRYTLLTEGVDDAVARVIAAGTIIVAVLLQRRRAA
jgi:simple sugar transport system permease protein/ribose transport system permease protein